MIARLALSLLLATLPLAPAQADEPSPVGIYDGGQIEVGTGLQLSEDGRFAYFLSYGALDEVAQGTWSLVDGALVLTSDSVTAPAFVLDGTEGGGGRKLTIEIAGSGPLPDGLFGLHVIRANGGDDYIDFEDARATIPIDKRNPPATIEMTVPLYEFVSPPIPVARGTRVMRFHFEPNDLGVVAFDHQVLPREAGGYALDRVDRHLIFRRVPDEEQSFGE